MQIGVRKMNFDPVSLTVSTFRNVSMGISLPTRGVLFKTGTKYKALQSKKGVKLRFNQKRNGINVLSGKN